MAMIFRLFHSLIVESVSFQNFQIAAQLNNQIYREKRFDLETIYAKIIIQICVNDLKEDVTEYKLPLDKLKRKKETKSRKPNLKHSRFAMIVNKTQDLLCCFFFAFMNMNVHVIFTRETT